MHEPDFWSNSADALELSIEGNRLIVRELADLARNLWQRMVRFVVDRVARTYGSTGICRRPDVRRP